MLEVMAISFFDDKIMCKYPNYTKYTWEDINDFILLRSVGFPDKNGKEIFEGDIDAFGYVVTYSADLNAGLGMNAGWYIQRDNFESWSELECDENFEVAGNIFENLDKAINNCHTNYMEIFE